jgi:hypothetical protein
MAVSHASPFASSVQPRGLHWQSEFPPPLLHIPPFHEPLARLLVWRSYERNESAIDAVSATPMWESGGSLGPSWCWISKPCRLNPICPKGALDTTESLGIPVEIYPYAPIIRERCTSR